MTQRVPGQRTGLSTTPRIINIGEDYRILPGPVVIDATYAIDGANTNKTDELRAGCLMGRINSGLWVPLKLTRVAAGFSGSGSGNSGVSLNVDDARFFKASDQIEVQTTGLGSGAQVLANQYENATVSSVDYTNNVLTLSAAISNPSVGSIVRGRGTSAGAGICRGILKETVRLLSQEPYNTTEYDTQGQILIEGLVDTDLILGDLSAVQADWTNHYVKSIIFDDDQGKD